MCSTSLYAGTMIVTSATGRTRSPTASPLGPADVPALESSVARPSNVPLLSESPAAQLPIGNGSACTARYMSPPQQACPLRCVAETLTLCYRADRTVSLCPLKDLKGAGLVSGSVN